MKMNVQLGAPLLSAAYTGHAAYVPVYLQFIFLNKNLVGDIHQNGESRNQFSTS